MTRKRRCRALGLVIGLSASVLSLPAFARSMDVDEQAATVLEAVRAFEREDYVTALRLFRGPADRGQAVAERYLGIMYFDGLGGLSRPQEARVWLEKAHAQGDADAAVELGVAYLEGFGTPKDQLRAFELFKGAAERGHAGALANVARMYRDGVAVAQDGKAALNWYMAAANLANPTAMHDLALLLADDHPTRGCRITFDHAKSI